MQFWPRGRAKSVVARIRTWKGKDTKLLGFAAYKVGMSHIIINDMKPNSNTKGMQVQVPVTILECPPLKIAAITLYTKDAYGLHCVGQIHADKLEKEVSRRLPPVKKQHAQKEFKNLAEVRIMAYTQPKLTGIGAKVPELFELGIGGTKAEDKLNYAKSLLGKDITINDVFTAGQQVDSTSITKGKGLQGPVKRFGIALRSHKSEKTKRGPGSLGPWHGAKLYRTPHAGQMGFHQRTEYNKQILNISNDVSKINPKGGFMRFGNVKNTYMIMKGSIGGAHKRLVTLTAPRRPDLKLPKEPPAIVYISTSTHQ